MPKSDRGEAGPPRELDPGGRPAIDPQALLLRDLLDRQPLLALINLLVVLATIMVLAEAASLAPILVWSLLMLLVQAGRALLWLGGRRGYLPAARVRLARWLTTSSTLVGLGWGGLGVMCGAGTSQVEAVFVPFVLAGMSAGAVTALPGHPPAFFTFVWAALLPYALTLAMQTDAVAETMALVTLVYAAGISAVGWQVHRTLRRAAELHLQNSSLVHRLDHARQDLEATVARRTGELQAANTALSREVAERRRSEQRVRHLLVHDPLTNLPNRLLLFDRLGQALARSSRFGTRTAVMVFDVDRFKDINDTFGHLAGDLLLRELAGRVRTVIRATDTAARIGGDEFALVMPDLGDSATAEALARRLLAACRAPFDLGGVSLQVPINIGAALFPEHGEDADVLLRAADAALYAAKAGGRDRFVLYSQALHVALSERRKLELEIKQAPALGQLRLDYQPRFALPDRRLTAVEALLRWHHPQVGILLPGQFVPAAETSGAIRELGRWVLAAACRQARRWRDAGRPLCVAINLSAQGKRT